MTFEERLEWLQANHEALITRRNAPIEGNGVYERYLHPVLTAEHAPLFWRYDFDRQTNPYLMERFGVHAAFNSGAIKWNGKYVLVVRVEGNLAVNGSTLKSTGAKQHVQVSDLEDRTAGFTQSGANKGLTFSDFSVTVRRSFVKPEPFFVVFETPTTSAIPYRIPAIARAYNGDLIAVADYRHSRADIGMANNGRIDLRARISKDNGQTWGEIFDIVQGKGGNSPDFMNVGFGDPCIVADRESGKVLVLSCAGNVSFPNGTRDNHQNIARFYSEDNGQTWSKPEDIAESIYSQFDKRADGPVRAMFIGSGKIIQSLSVATALASTAAAAASEASSDPGIAAAAASASAACCEASRSSSVVTLVTTASEKHPPATAMDFAGASIDCGIPDAVLAMSSITLPTEVPVCFTVSIWELNNPVIVPN